MQFHKWFQLIRPEDLDYGCYGFSVLYVNTLFGSLKMTFLSPASCHLFSHVANIDTYFFLTCLFQIVSSIPVWCMRVRVCSLQRFRNTNFLVSEQLCVVHQPDCCLPVQLPNQHCRWEKEPGVGSFPGEK